MNYTLGGAFASRINMNLREVHGYTYGACSGFTQLSRRRHVLLPAGWCAPTSRRPRRRR